MVDKKTADLIENMRELRFTLANSSNLMMNHNKDLSYEDLISSMIEKYPEVWGIGGSMRPWLNRYAEEHGIDGDFGLTNDQGPYNERN